MKTSTALKRTLAKLWDGERGGWMKFDRFICNASYSASSDIFDDVADIVCPIIESYLGRDTVEDWLLKNVEGYDRNDDKKIQATRKAWLESLIKEYTAIGD